MSKRIVFGNLEGAERRPGVWHSGGLESDGIGGKGVD